MTKKFIHENALCESVYVGEGTKVWAFSHILPKAVIGKNCNICDHIFIENDVEIGDNVTIKSGVQLWDGITLEDNVFIGPNATFCNDNFPRSKKYPEKFLQTKICKGASIGANATILPGVTVGQDALVGAGAVVTSNVPPRALVVGNPARIVNYVDTNKIPMGIKIKADDDKGAEKKINLGVGNCELWSMPVFSDMRGNLLVTEYSAHLPFIPKRSFYVYGVKNNEIRGEHAHKECDQFLMALAGSINIVINDGVDSKEIVLDSPRSGLFLKAGTWSVQYKFSQNAILSVFASHQYEEEDYIRDYNEFCKWIDEQK